jgi:hypothetical protein
MDIEITHGVAPQNWDKDVLKCAGAGIFQTSRWARVSAAITGAEPTYVRQAGGDGGHCMLLRSGHLSDRLRRRRLTQPFVGLARQVLPVVEAQGGPCFPRGTSPERAAEFVAQLWCATNDLGAGSVSLEPPSGQGLPEEVGAAFPPGVTTRRRATLIVDLTKDYQAHMHRSVLKNVRKCQREGVTIEIVEPSDLGEWHQVYQGFRRRRELPGFSRQQLDAEVEHFGDWRLHFAARWRGEMIAVMAVLVCNGRLTEVELATSPVCERERLHATDFLKFHAMVWGSGQGHREFDQAGIAVIPRSEKEAGIRRYKEKYGGTYTESTCYTLSSGWIRRARSLRRWLVARSAGNRLAA